MANEDLPALGRSSAETTADVFAAQRRRGGSWSELEIVAVALLVGVVLYIATGLVELLPNGSNGPTGWGKVLRATFFVEFAWPAVVLLVSSLLTSLGMSRTVEWFATGDSGLGRKDPTDEVPGSWRQRGRRSHTTALAAAVLAVVMGVGAILFALGETVSLSSLPAAQWLGAACLALVSLVSAGAALVICLRVHRAWVDLAAEDKGEEPRSKEKLR